MRVKHDPTLSGKELFAYLRANKDAIIKTKCSLPIKSEETPVSSILSVAPIIATKADPLAVIEVESKNEINVSVIANTANWCDSHLDVLIPDCWKKTIKENGPSGTGRIYHLKDHCHETEGVIGKPTALYSKDFTLIDLGIKQVGGTQCLVLDSVVKENYDSKAFRLYSDKLIKQHSIGLQYVKMVLCINDSESPSEFINWNTYYNQIINKDFVNKYGYFWAVLEIKLLEVSAVLWGSNEITPVLETETKNIEPLPDTQKTEPTKVTQKTMMELLSKIETVIKIK